MLNYFKSFLGPLIIAGILYALEIIKMPVCDGLNLICALHRFTFEYKPILGLSSIVIFALTDALLNLKGINNKRNLIQLLLIDFLKSNVTRDMAISRITMFDVAYGFFTIFYFFRATLRNVMFFIQRKSLVYRISLFPIPTAKYLRVYKRAGNPGADKRSVFFKAPIVEEDVNGVTPQVYYSGVNFRVKDLPDIDPKNLIDYDNVNEIEDNDLKSRVLDYMKDTKTSNFKRLKTFRRLSTLFLAFPLFCGRNDKHPTHVIILDSTSSNLETKELENNIKVLSNNIQTILKN